MQAVIHTRGNGKMYGKLHFVWKRRMFSSSVWVALISCYLPLSLVHCPLCFETFLSAYHDLTPAMPPKPLLLYNLLTESPYIYIYNTLVLIKICRFLINVVKFMQTLTKLDLSTLCKGSTEERTQRNKWKIWHSLGLERRSSVYLAPMLYPLSYGCQLAELNFVLFSFQILNSLRCLYIYIYT